MISKSLALDLLNIGLSTGADYSEIYQESIYVHSLVLNYHRIETVSTRTINGVALRLLKGPNQVNGYTSEISKKSLIDLAKELASAFEGSPAKEVKTLKNVKKGKLNQHNISFTELDDERILARLKAAEEAAYAVSPEIINVTIALSAKEKEVVIFNSDEKKIIDLRPYISLAISVQSKVASGKVGNGNYRNCLCVDYDKIADIDLVEEAKKAAADALEDASAKPSPSGVMTVVIGNGFGGTLFHEACGHPLEAECIFHKRSTYCDKIGEQIASPLVTAIDDGTIDTGWGTINYDDEGTKSTKNVLIKDGILQGYMVDRLSGKNLGLTPTGACRRQSYRFTPTTRMTNTYIAAGKSTFDEIISSVEDGIYCVSFGGGSVDPSTNNFNFSASKVYEIKNGKIGSRLEPVVLVGFGYDILKKIDMVGDDLSFGPGFCGASSGSIEVLVGQPTVRISGIVVGGTAKEVK